MGGQSPGQRLQSGATLLLGLMGQNGHAHAARGSDLWFPTLGKKEQEGPFGPSFLACLVVTIPLALKSAPWYPFPPSLPGVWRRSGHPAAPSWGSACPLGPGCWLRLPLASPGPQCWAGSWRLVRSGGFQRTVPSLTGERIPSSSSSSMAASAGLRVRPSPCESSSALGQEGSKGALLVSFFPARAPGWKRRGRPGAGPVAGGQGRGWGRGGVGAGTWEPRRPGPPTAFSLLPVPRSRSGKRCHHMRGWLPSVRRLRVTTSCF